MVVCDCARRVLAVACCGVCFERSLWTCCLLRTMRYDRSMMAGRMLRTYGLLGRMM